MSDDTDREKRDSGRRPSPVRKPWHAPVLFQMDVSATEVGPGMRHEEEGRFGSHED